MSKKHLGDYLINMRQKVAEDECSKTFTCLNKISLNRLLARIIPMKKIEVNEAIKKSFYLQVLIAKMLHADSLLRVISIIESENNCYVITENLDGHNLRSLLKKRKVLPEQILKVCLGRLMPLFNEMLEKKIIHGSINLDNIFIENNKPKLGFFADYQTFVPCAAKSQEQKDFLAPETVKSDTYSSKSDIWALGLVLYKCLTGCLPWQAQKITQEQFFNKEKEQKVEFLQNEEFKEISPEFKSLIMGCLNFDPAERFTWPELLLHPLLENF